MQFSTTSRVFVYIRSVMPLRLCGVFVRVYLGYELCQNFLFWIHTVAMQWLWKSVGIAQACFSRVGAGCRGKHANHFHVFGACMSWGSVLSVCSIWPFTLIPNTPPAHLKKRSMRSVHPIDSRPAYFVSWYMHLKKYKYLPNHKCAVRLPALRASNKHSNHWPLKYPRTQPFATQSFATSISANTFIRLMNYPPTQAVTRWKMRKRAAASRWSTHQGKSAVLCGVVRRNDEPTSVGSLWLLATWLNIRISFGNTQ
jgi:hypothetical protein